MKALFPKKIFIFDIDNTLLDWNASKVFFHDLRYSFSMLKTQKELNRSRGQRSPFRSFLKITSPPPIAEDIVNVLTYLRSNHHPIAIFSDISHPELYPFFADFNIQAIISGHDIQVTKPLADGLWQIKAMLGNIGDQLFMIGDQEETDHRSAMAIGAEFIPISKIQDGSWKDIF